MKIDNRHAAICDCVYALSLSETALQAHLKAWIGESFDKDISQMNEDDKEYCFYLKEIVSKLHSNECLLKEI